MKLSISVENFKYLLTIIHSLIDGKPSYIYSEEDLEIFSKLDVIKKETETLGKLPSLEDAKKNPSDFNIMRNYIGWTISHIDSPDIELMISDEDAKELLRLMDEWNIKDQAYEVD